MLAIPVMKKTRVGINTMLKEGNNKLNKSANGSAKR